MIRSICLFDDSLWEQLFPLTYFRPVASLRVGIQPLAEAWQEALGAEEAGFQTQPHLQEKYPTPPPSSSADTLLICGGLLPGPEAISALRALQPGQALYHEDRVLAAFPQNTTSGFNPQQHIASLQRTDWIHTAKPALLEHPWDLFQLVDKAIRWDYARLTDGRQSAPRSATVRTLGEAIFLEEGVRAEFCTLNAEKGPIYIGAGAEIMEGCCLRGPLFIGAHTVVKMGAKIYGPTSIGAQCRIGGEVSQSVVQDFTNKGHDGFIGHAVLGSWCNLGADTNCSNLKNNYSEVKVWDIATGGFKRTGLQFCGLIMGDHSKCGINTMFNTGTTVGAYCNIFGTGFPRTWLPSFSWGGAQGLRKQSLEEALSTARRVTVRRHVEFSELDEMAARWLLDSMSSGKREL